MTSQPRRLETIAKSQLHGMSAGSNPLIVHLRSGQRLAIVSADGEVHLLADLLQDSTAIDEIRGAVLFADTSAAAHARLAAEARAIIDKDQIRRSPRATRPPANTATPIKSRRRQGEPATRDDRGTDRAADENGRHPSRRSRRRDRTSRKRRCSTP